MSHSFSFLKTSKGLSGGKHYQEIAISIWRVVLQNFVKDIFMLILTCRLCFIFLGENMFPMYRSWLNGLWITWTSMSDVRENWLNSIALSLTPILITSSTFHIFNTLSCHRHWQVLSSLHTSSQPASCLICCLFVHSEWGYHSNSFKDFSHGPGIGWGDVL